MRRQLVAVAAALGLLLTIVTPVGAITNGTPDNGAHPYVGLIGFYDASGAWLWRCSGTLIAPTVVLTAGHCTGIDPTTGEVPARAQVWFDEHIAAPPTPPDPNAYPVGGGVWGTPHPNPLWTGYLTIPDTHDVGVVVLDEAAPGITEFGALPEPGVLDTLATRRGPDYPSFTVVGYGLQQVKPVQLSDRSRLVGTVSLVNLRSHLTDGYNVEFSNNAGHWTGGTCFGDSGGPAFLGTSNVVVAVTSFGMNGNCAGVGFNYRVDIAESIGFIDEWLP